MNSASDGQRNCGNWKQKEFAERRVLKEKMDQVEADALRWPNWVDQYLLNAW
jgi:hypothetical protein